MIVCRLGDRVLVEFTEDEDANLRVILDDYRNRLDVKYGGGAPADYVTNLDDIIKGLGIK